MKPAVVAENTVAAAPGESKAPRAAMVLHASPSWRFGVAGLCRECGLEARLYAEPFEALLALSTRPPPDLVFLDVATPGGRGLEILEILKEDPRLRHTPVVALAGIDQASWGSRALDRGAAHVMFRPDGYPEKFAEMVASLFRKPDRP